MLRRFLSTGLALAAIAVVFVLYAVKHDTRRLDREVRVLEKRIERTESDIAVLEAEWSHLSQPERIARLARQHLSMRPARPEQYRDLEDFAPISGPAQSSSEPSR